MHSNKNYSTILDYVILMWQCYLHFGSPVIRQKNLGAPAIKTASCSAAMCIERKIRLASDLN